MNLEEKVTDLECKLTFQEDTIEILNETVLAQQKSIDQLMEHMRKMQSQLVSLQQDHAVVSPEQEPPPPHY
ncbi:SlyX family protein [Pleionea sediminis]|uniref:SlyX family protein n=1 Tax=Pleionea sediminis TaxID=2569479 RepID=UPI001185A0C5|nr:SlyX family protein [Pleionea sediminis]